MTVKNDSPIFCKVCDHQIPVSGNASSYVTCQHCGTRNKIAKGDSWRTVIFSLTALIFYLPANILPFITVDLYGSHNTPTIWGGVVTLTE
ncbi:MAG: paraquat-inducible protein A, partial [Bdellovibrio sp.]